MNFDYKKTCLNLLKDLPEKQKVIILRRFGLESGKRETLESIGKDFGITRERVRQIESDGFSKLKSKIETYQEIFKYFYNEIKKNGGLKKEEILFSQLEEENSKPYVFFLLTLGEPFKRFFETKEFYSFWTIDSNFAELAKKIINFLFNKIKEKNQPFSLKELSSLCVKNFQIKEDVLSNYLEVSKIIQKNQENLYGLKIWAEINPKSIKDKAYLVFKKELKPLHFSQVSQLIGPDALTQTVHNELIRDTRFILVGRGLYALKEWGYESGDVKDVISKILRESQKPLSKEIVLEKVLKQRMVKGNTVLLNLCNKKYFLKNSQGEYTIKTA